MRISGLCVCCDYAHHFVHTLTKWKRGLDQILVVTRPGDLPTLDLCRQHDVPTLETDVFTARGAWFNKAGALNLGLERLRPSLSSAGDWLLLFDADIDPGPDWRKAIDRWLTPGVLHGAPRVTLTGEPENDRNIAGWFMLYHARDRRGLAPLVEYNNASGYDNDFVNRWPRHLRQWLELQVTHLGRPGVDWCGVNDHDAMHELRRQRRVSIRHAMRRHDRHRIHSGWHERMTQP